MADQVERIVLEIDDAKALIATARTNAALERMEKRAGVAVGSLGRVPETVAAGIASATQRSQSQIERLVADAEKKAAAMGRSASQRLIAERDLILKRVAGDSEAIKRVTDAYAKMGETAAASWDKIKSGAMWAAGIAVSMGAAATAVFHFVEGQTKAAESMQNLSDRTGLTLRETHLYTAAARAAGVDVNALATGMKRLSEAMVEGGPESSKASKGLADIGVKAFDSNRQLKTTGVMLLEIGSALSKLPTDAARIRAVTDIFGKGGMELLPMFKDLPRQLQTMRELGYGFEDGVTKTLLRGDQAIDKLEASWNRLKERMASGIIAYIEIVSRGGPLPGGGAVGAFQGLAAVGRGMSRLGGLIAPWLTPGPSGVLGPPSPEFAGGFQQAVQSTIKSSGWSGFMGGSGELQLQLRLQEAQERLKTAIAEKDVKAANAAFSLIESLKKQNSELEKQRALVEKLGTFQFTEGDIPDIITGRIRRAPSLYSTAQQRERDRQVAAAFELQAGGFQREAALLIPRAGLQDLQGRYDANLKATERFQERALAYQIKMVELTTGPGGELAAVEKIYALRVAAAKAKGDWDAVAEAAWDREERVLELQKQRFDEIKSSFEGLFDAAFSGARNFWDAARRMALSIFLAPVKRALGDWVASMFAARPGGAGGTGGGFLGALGNVFGGGGAGMGMPAYMTPAGGPRQMTAADASWLVAGNQGVAGMGPMGFGMGTTPGGGLSAASLIPQPSATGGWRGMFPTGTWMGQTFQGAGMARAGVGAAGMGLVQYGMGTSGTKSTASLIGGGAAVGASYGGPLGAGIGAAAGATTAGWKNYPRGSARGALLMGDPGSAAFYGMGFGPVKGGLMSLWTTGSPWGFAKSLFKSAAEKVTEKIETIWHVKVDTGLANQIANMAKEQFGGNLDMAVRAPQVRELVELYAMATGQKMVGRNILLPTTISQSGGRLTTMPSYLNGAVYTPPPRPANMTTGLAGGGGGSTVNISLDKAGTESFLAGRMTPAILGNPRAVATANMEAGRGNFGRREQAAQAIAPGLTLA